MKITTQILNKENNESKTKYLRWFPSEVLFVIIQYIFNIYNIEILNTDLVPFLESIPTRY